MREIKFRAWDGKRMYLPLDCDESDFYVSCEGEVKYTEEVGYERYLLTRTRRNWELMQYTGLRDKNGVEIYEGDILRGPTDYFGTGVVSFRHGRFCVYYSKTKYKWSPKWYGIYTHSKTATVIGNIYENPELLNDTQEQEQG